MQVKQRSLIYDAFAQESSGRVAFFDSLLRLQRGVWLSGFTTGQTKHHHQGTIRLARSGDDGVSWAPLLWRFSTNIEGIPGSLAGAEMVETEPGRLLLFATWCDRSDPDRPLFDPQTEGILRSRQLMAVSTDEGDSWSDWREIPTPGLSGCALTGPVVKWSDGAIALAFESFKEYDDPRPARHAAWVLISRDGGASFEPPALIAQDPENRLYFWDQRLCAGPSAGEYYALFWTHDRAGKRDRRVHFSHRFLYGDMQADAPPTPVETTIAGQIAAPLRLEDGRLFAFVVDRHQPGTMRLWQSRDSGRSWPEKDCLTVHTHDEQATVTQGGDDIDFAQYWEDMGKWSFGHPSIRAAGADRVLISWYAGSPTCMSVHAAMVDVGDSLE